MNWPLIVLYLALIYCFYKFFESLAMSLAVYNHKHGQHRFRKDTTGICSLCKKEEEESIK